MFLQIKQKGYVNLLPPFPSNILGSKRMRFTQQGLGIADVTAGH